MLPIGLQITVHAQKYRHCMEDIFAKKVALNMSFDIN
jgi:hypothetical protein